MKKEVRGGVSLVLASAMLVASPMAAGMTETVQAEELTVDSKVAQIQGESIIPRADQVPGNEELFAQYVEQTFYGEESESYRTPLISRTEKRRTEANRQDSMYLRNLRFPLRGRGLHMKAAHLKDLV